MDDKYIVAIEIGSSKIRGALASIDPTGALNILAVQDEHVSDSVRYGHVKNVEDVSTKVDSICRKLENARAIQPRKIAGVYIGLSGCTIGASLATETSRFEVDTEIDSSSVERLKGLITTVGHGEKEIYELLPYEFLVDNESTLNPVGRIGRSIKGTFSLIEGVPAIKNNLNRVFERLSLQVNGYIVSALAQANMVLTPDEKQLGCMFVDFGCETTTIIIYKKGVLRYMATLPMGSRNITRDLVSLNHLEQHAESIKRSIGIVPAGDGTRHAGQHSIEQPELNSYISARAGEIVANVIANIEYAGLTPADLPSGIVTVGGGARLKGLGDMIASQSNMKVRTGNTPRNIRISDTSISADDITDVVALLIAAAERNPMDCLSPVVRPDEQAYPGKSSPQHTGGYAPDDYDDGDITVGKEDDEGLDPDDFIDPPKGWLKGNGRSKTPHKNTQRNNESHPNPIITRIKEKFTKLFSDDESDRYVDEEEE